MKHAKLLSLLIAASLTVSTAPATVWASSGTESVEGTQDGLVGAAEGTAQTTENTENSAGSEEAGASAGSSGNEAVAEATGDTNGSGAASQNDAGATGGSSGDAIDAGAASESSAESGNASAEGEEASAGGAETASTSETVKAESSLSDADSAASSAASAETTLVGAAASSADFYFTTDDGQTVNAYKNSSGTYYLFLPSDVSSVSAIHYNGDISAVSEGTVDETQKELVGPYAVDATLTVTRADGTTATIVAEQSTLPSLSLTLNGTTLDTVKTNGKDVKYAGNSVVLTDPADSSQNINAKNVEFKGRGNTSWTMYDKKGYQIKFAKKTNVLGMGKAKKWVLLSNGSDPTMVRNATAFNMAKKMGLAYTPDYQFVDFWVDGEYQGTYMVTEKIEIGSDRVDLGDGGIVAEYDNAFYAQETYFRDYFGSYITLKDPDADEVGSRFSEFESAFDAVEKKIDTNAKTDAGWNDLCQYLDVESVAKLMMLNDYTANVECWYTSLYFYQDGSDGKICAGPAWDFDSAAEGAYKGENYSYYQKNNPIYKGLCAYPQFRSLYRKLYQQYKSDFAAMASDVQNTAASLGKSVTMNYQRWEVLGTTDPKGNSFAGTYDANVSSYVSWLTNRAASFSSLRSCNDCYDMYRMYNPNSGEHFYTGNKDERERARRSTVCTTRTRATTTTQEARRRETAL